MFFFLLIQYVSCLLKNFNPNKSLPNILKIKLIGVRTIKYTKAITIGAIVTPKISPNFIQALLKGLNIIGFKKEIVKKINAITKDHTRKFEPDRIGQRAIIKNIKPNKIPKFFSADLFFIDLFKFFNI